MSSFGDMVRVARHFRGINQKLAAQKLDVTQAVYSRYENGLKDPDSHLLDKAASAFDFPRSFFTASDTIYGAPLSVHTMLRSKKSETPASIVNMTTAELNIRLMHLRRFLENVNYDVQEELPRYDVDESIGGARQIALNIRKTLMLPEGPIRNLTRIVEERGVIVGVSDFGGASISGVTFAAPGTPPIVLLNKTQPADRLRFTLAHELGHIVMHRYPSPQMEQEANTFASELLIPLQSLKETIRGRKITLETIASLKMEWRVSMQAILMAIQKLEVISSNQVRYLWQQISAKGWRLREPPELDFEFDRPTVLSAIIKTHTDQLGFDAQEILALSKIKEADFEKLYGPIVPILSQTIRRPHLRLIK